MAARIPGISLFAGVRVAVAVRREGVFMGVTGWPRSISWQEFDPRSFRPVGQEEDAQIAPLAEAPESGIKVLKEGNKLKIGPFTIKVSVDKTQSWVVTSAKSETLLNHEQGHYNIAGLGAWELHRDLEALRAGYTSQLSDLIRAALKRSQEKTQTLQDYYDSKRETDHGRHAAKQKEWDQKIADCMKNNNRALPNPPPRSDWESL